MLKFTRLLAALLCLMLVLCVPAMAEDAVRVVALKGPTAMGLVKQMKDSEAGGGYEYNIIAAVDEVAPLLVKGEAGSACVPANLASVLYNNTQGGVKVLAINTLGVLYIVEKGDSIHSAADLKGRTVYASGKGATPEYALNYILTGNGIDPENDLTIEWKSEHAECLAALMEADEGVAMLPQPFVTTAMMKADDLRVALDLNEEWAALGTDSQLITGVAVVRSEFAESRPEAVAGFLDAYSASVEWVNENTEEAAALVGGYDIVPEAVAVKALPACSITFIEGDAMKQALSGYLQVLFDANPKAVGGKLPDDAFYFAR